MKYCLIIVFISCFTARSYSQGCSDAGFCTMGAMKPDQHYSKRINVKLRSMELSGYRGKTLLSPVIQSMTVDMNVSITEKLFLQGKLPYMWVDGRLGKTSGLSDISLSLTRHMITTQKGSLSMTLGTKIPTNGSNLTSNNNQFDKTEKRNGDLPMYYQTSLGSYDAIFGASWINEKWLFATGIQMALTQNKNEFRWSEWPDSPVKVVNGDTIIYVNEYAIANHLKRGTDVMLRVERNFRFTNFNFNVGLLPIYRITKDEITNKEGLRIKVEGTTGLALSALVGAGYSFDVNNSLKFIYGHKLTHRDVNPDGLTRHNVMSLSYVYRF